jgi:hypothetical protein
MNQRQGVTLNLIGELNMKKSDAMNIFGLTVLTAESLKKAYRTACAKYHPDRNPAGLEMMKAVNVAYDTLKGLPDDTDKTDGTGDSFFFGDKLNDAINAALAMEGVNIEVCGNWVWLSGNTKPHKDAIKAAGFWWASKKSMWYFRPAEWKSSSRGTWDIEKIRDTHGSVNVARKEREKLEA